MICPLIVELYSVDVESLKKGAGFGKIRNQMKKTLTF